MELAPWNDWMNAFDVSENPYSIEPGYVVADDRSAPSVASTDALIDGKVKTVRVTRYKESGVNTWVYRLLVDIGKTGYSRLLGGVVVADTPTKWRVVRSVIDRRYQRQGLGTFLYRKIINDAAEHGMKLYSDTISRRTEAAEALWRRLVERFPERVRSSRNGFEYSASGPLRRPEIRVRQHRRRSPR
jgi:GNAT superfamily N-acetyltransferase